jgi:hypothetical protein
MDTDGKAFSLSAFIGVHPRFNSAIRNPQSAIRNSSGIALVITLLMLSAITFLAVAFLVLTRTQRDSASVTLDVTTAKEMSATAVARAQSVITARMMAHGNLFNFDYMTSQNFFSPGGFVPGSTTTVNYDYYTNGNPMSPTVNGGVDWAQNIANGFLDPSPPVFIRTNANPAAPADRRFYIDLNHNGRFETNGLLPYIQDNGVPLVIGNVNVSNFYNGEPEWIGVLQYPNLPHSATNHYIGRYAFVVLPIGKMLDYNFIHNYSKYLLGGFPTVMPPAASGTGNTLDGFARDQGVGPWELNLAGLLWGVDSNCYNAYGGNVYHYIPAIAPNTGYAFDDAYSILRFRYADNYGPAYPLPLSFFFGASTPNLSSIDEYGAGGVVTTFANPPNSPWPGSYSTNNVYNIQDLFDTNKTSYGFVVARLLAAGSRTNSYDRYMFQRLLASIGYGSIPELQTYVYGDVVTTNPAVQPPTVLRTKVNVNWDNTWQILNGLNTSPTNLVPWTQEAGGALGFFTNAAESLLRSQNFRITNYAITPSPAGPVYTPLGLSYIHFGVTNIPIYNSTNPSIRYTEQIHRMLQLAANIYDATRTDTVVPAGSLPHPSVFRPICRTTNYGGTNQAAFIVGYASVTTDAAGRIQSLLPTPQNPFTLKLPSDPTITTNDNLWGIPWVIGAVKGLPSFDRFTASSSWMVTRKLLFKRWPAAGAGVRTNGIANRPPEYTNQFLIMSITNGFGMDAWNSYMTPITQPFEVMASTVVSIVLSDTLHPAYGFSTNYFLTTNFFGTNWPGVGGYVPERTTNGMLALMQTNVASLPSAYFSEYTDQFVPVYSTNTNSGNFATNFGVFLPGDRQQTSWPLHNWVLGVTNQVLYAMVDTQTGQAVDFVNLGPFGITSVLTNLLYSATNGGALPVQGSGTTNSSVNYWDPTQLNQNFLPQGVLNQIANGTNFDTNFAMEIAGIVSSNRTASRSNLYFSCSNNPAATYSPGLDWHTLLINDPLVHYTVSDLTSPRGDVSQVLTYNQRYQPWPDPSANSRVANMTLKDPLITRADDWNFHTNIFPSIGGLGRVHRGTPWQTVFLKADGLPEPNGNPYTWLATWVSTMDTYPTNDYALLDLFTAAPSDNAARGLLSVNQVNDAPWYALFSEVAINTVVPQQGGHTNGPPPDTNHTLIDPTNIAPLLNTALTGINATRSNQPDGVFHNTGSVFASPALTIASPFLNFAAYDYKDEQVEEIPQQVAGLLKLGMPQFVIYGFGQALKPKDIYFGGPPNFNLCTNYQITGEYVTRYVCHVVGDPAAANVKIQVDSVNIIPAD